MTTRVSTRMVDNGLGPMVAQFKSLRRKEAVDVGLFDGSAETQFIGSVHEFGAPEANIPQRSFMRATFDKNKEKYSNIARSRIVRGTETPREAVREALKDVGITMVADVKRAIIKRIPPDLSEATVDRKRRAGYARPAIPLFATGALFNSVSYRVEST